MRIFAVFLALMFLSPAYAQQGVQPSGSFTPGHTVQVLNPSGTAIGDAGGSAGSDYLPGQNYLTGTRDHQYRRATMYQRCVNQQSRRVSSAVPGGERLWRGRAKLLLLTQSGRYGASAATYC